MAIRKRQGRARAYLVYWTNPWTKKRESASYATEEEAKKADSLIRHRLKFERDSFRPKTKEPAKKQPDNSLETVYAAYLAEKQFNEKSMCWQLEGMRIPLETIGRKRIDAITRLDLAMILQKEKAKGVKGTTVRGRVKILFTVLRWALKRGYLDILPVFPELPPARYEHFIPPTLEEIRRIMECAPPHIQRVVVFGCKLGVRVGPSELFKIRWCDVDLERKVVRVTAAQKNHDEPWREVPIKSSLLHVFKVWKEEDEAKGIEYVINYKGKQIINLRHSWRCALKNAGITRKIRPYDLRHAFATEALAAGADPGTVAKLMGHASTDMIFAHYQHVMTKQKVAAIEALPDIEFFEKGDQKKVTNEKRSYLQ